MLDIDVVLIGNGINTDYLDISEIMEKTHDKIAPNKTGSTRYKHSLFVQLYIIWQHGQSLLKMSRV